MRKKNLFPNGWIVNFFFGMLTQDEMKIPQQNKKQQQQQ